VIDVSDDERRRLMKLKKRMSKKRPHFRQFEEWRFVRIKDHWRRPKGIDNKMRQKRKGWPKTVNIGYRSPKAVRHYHPSGLQEVFVYNTGDLTIVDPDSQVARIGSSVGKRKRKEIIREAELLGIKLLNPGDIDLDEEEFFEDSESLEETDEQDDAEVEEIEKAEEEDLEEQ
jgi:large subunit ribosomal protein L32e